MKRLLFFSLLLNLLFLVAIAFAVNRLGGWNYAWHRLRHTENGPYANRANLFAQLPFQAGALLMLGDSQIEQCEWHELLGGSRPVLNRGIVGDGVEGLLSRLDADVLRQQPAQVFVCIGANDLLFGKSVADIETTYREIAQKIRHGVPQSDLILISVLPVNNTIKQTGLDNGEVRALNERIRQIARDWAVPYLDVHGALTDGDANLATQFTADGLHLNGAGYLVWKKTMEPFLK